MVEQQQQQEPEVGVDVMVQKVTYAAVKRRWWIVTPMVIGALLGCVASTRVSNHYESEAAILVAHQQVSERYVTPNDTSDLRETLLLVEDTILSRTQLLQIINDFDLYPEQRKRLAPEDLVELMRSHITIAAMEKTPDSKDLNSFKISFEGTDPHVAQEVTSRLTTLFIQGDLNSRISTATATTEFLNQHLQSAADNLKQQEARVRDFKMQNLGQLPEQSQANMSILTGLHAQLQNTESVLGHAREQQVFLESLISHYRSLSSAGVAIPGAPSSVSPADETKQELSQLRTQRADLLARYTEQYPDVVKLDEQIKELQAQLDASSKAASAKDATAKSVPLTEPTSADVNLAQYNSQLEANHAEIANATADEKRLEAQIAEYQSRLNMTPVREQQLADLLRDYDLSKKNYDDLLAKETQSELATSLQEHQQGAQFKIIDPASLPMKPSSPLHAKIALGGLAAGLAVGVGIVLLFEMLDHSLLDEKDLSRYFSFPLMIGLAALPTPQEKKKESLQHMLEWAAAAAACFLVCVSEFYICRRG